MAKQKILVIDDERDFTDVLQTKLTGAGYDCVAINSGSEAFSAAKQERPDLIVLDVMMAGCSGFEVCRNIRKDPIIYATPVIFLTAMSGEPEMVHGLEQGGDDYLLKPFEPNELLHHIKAFLADHDKSLYLSRQTGLPGQESMRLEVSKKLARGEMFALCYFEVTSYPSFLKHYKPKDRDRLLSFVGEQMAEAERELDLYEFLVGHLGGGHFLAVVTVDRFEEFCHLVRENFCAGLLGIYKAMKDGNKYESALEKKKLGEDIPEHYNVGLVCSVVTNSSRQFTSTQKMFEALAQIRKKVQSPDSDGFLVDRRT
ncbi:response regulator transcription factor [Candidatus Hydrogenedentota bacterium]